MIYFVTRHHDYTMEGWLAKYGGALSDRVEVVAYEDLEPGTELPSGAFVFTDHDRMGPAHRELARRLWSALESSGAPVRLLNHPDRVLTRLPLLQEFAARGWNRFRAWPADAVDDSVRYPVFVRERIEHTGHLTELIHDRETLDRELARLSEKLPDVPLIVVEFCDTSRESGAYRKYSAFRVGDRIVPRYIDFGSHWMVKAELRVYDAEKVEQNMRYVRENPHEEWLREAFEAASVDYGRIDYGMLDGQPQTWEINLNPTIGPTPMTRKLQSISITPEAWNEAVRPSRELFHETFAVSLAELDRVPGAGAPIRLDLDQTLLERTRAEWEATVRPGLFRTAKAFLGFLRQPR